MASEAKKPIKGILKNATSALIAAQPPPTTAPPNKADPRAVAIHHARLLQDRKDTEAAIFTNILTLLDYPLHPSHPPSAPHPADVDGFASLVHIFQPSDYDDLIVERNLTDNRCGYALCPNKRRKFRGAGTYKLVNKGRKDFDIVETAELEKWCSTECTRRALWIKVQLNETAAWERVGLPELKLELYPEKQANVGKDDKPKAEAGPAEEHEGRQRKDAEQQNSKNGQGEPERLGTEMAKLQIKQDRKAATDATALALERGDGGAPTESMRSVEVVIREKTVMTQAEAPSLGDNPAKGDTIEGYKARFRADAGAAKSSLEAEEDSDWEM